MSPQIKSNERGDSIPVEGYEIVDSVTDTYGLERSRPLTSDDGLDYDAVEKADPQLIWIEDSMRGHGEGRQRVGLARREEEESDSPLRRPILARLKEAEPYLIPEIDISSSVRHMETDCAPHR